MTALLKALLGILGYVEVPDLRFTGFDSVTDLTYTLTPTR